MDATINERLAIVETQIAQMQKAADERNEKQDEILDKLNTVVADMKSAKSFMGGAMWIGMGMVTVIWKILPWLVSMIRAKTGNG